MREDMGFFMATKDRLKLEEKNKNEGREEKIRT